MDGSAAACHDPVSAVAACPCFGRDGGGGGGGAVYAQAQASSCECLPRLPPTGGSPGNTPTGVGPYGKAAAARSALSSPLAAATAQAFGAALTACPSSPCAWPCAPQGVTCHLARRRPPPRHAPTPLQPTRCCAWPSNYALYGKPLTKQQRDSQESVRTCEMSNHLLPYKRNATFFWYNHTPRIPMPCFYQPIIAGNLRRRSPFGGSNL